MTPISDKPVNKGAGPQRPFPAYPAPVKALRLYDKDARSVAGAQTTDFSPIYASLLQSEVPGIADYTLVQAAVTPVAGKALQIAELLQQGVVMALGNKGGIAIHQYSNGSVAICCIILQLTDRVKIAGIEAGADLLIQKFLKECYAGWHHLFHEVLAMASRFATTPVCDTTIEELVTLIQVPSRFPA